MDRVVITRAIVGPCHMQVCAHKDATDEEILTLANRLNPSGTSNGWTAIVRELSEFWGDKRPVKCQDDPERIHYMLSC